jgi:O-antigen/teichoic acid export membrane protein
MKTDSKKQGIGQFVSGSIVLTLSNVIIKAANFLFLPLYTRYLSSEELGISDLISNLTAFIAPLLIWGFDSAFSAFYYDEDSDVHRERVFNTAFFFLAASSGMIVFLMLLSPGFSVILFGNEEYKSAIMISLLAIAVSMWSLPFSLSLRMKNRMMQYSVVLVTSSLALLFSNVFFVVYVRLGYFSLIVSSLLVNVLQFALFWRLGGDHVRIRYFDKNLLRKMLVYATPMVPLTVLNWLLSLSDRYIVNYYHGQDAVGVYGIGTRFVNVLNVITNSVFVSFTTFAYANKNEEGAKAQYSRVLDGIYLIIAIMAWTAGLFGKEVVLLMTTQEYAQAYTILPALMFGQVCYAVSTIVGYGIGFAKKTQYFLWSTAAGAVTNILLNLIFIPDWGIQAAATTTFLGYFMVMLWHYFLGQKVYPCRYGFKKIMITLMGLYAGCLICMQVQFLLKLVIYTGGVAILVFLYRGILCELVSAVWLKLHKRG